MSTTPRGPRPDYGKHSPIVGKPTQMRGTKPIVGEAISLRSGNRVRTLHPQGGNERKWSNDHHNQQHPHA
jgi:hypothetical protein